MSTVHPRGWKDRGRVTCGAVRDQLATVRTSRRSANQPARQTVLGPVPYRTSQIKGTQSSSFDVRRLAAALRDAI